MGQQGHVSVELRRGLGQADRASVAFACVATTAARGATFRTRRRMKVTSGVALRSASRPDPPNGAEPEALAGGEGGRPSAPPLDVRLLADRRGHRRRRRCGWTPQVVGAYHLLEAPDLNEAIRLAFLIPEATAANDGVRRSADRRTRPDAARPAGRSPAVAGGR